jgi:hypothetical protein
LADHTPASALKPYTITDESHPYKYVGIGTQYNNGLYSQLTQYSYGYKPTDYPMIEKLIKKMNSQHIRVFYDSEPFNIPANKNPMNYPKDTDDRDSFRKVIALAQETPGATVNITYWHSPYTIGDTNIEGTPNIKVPFACPQMEAFAEEFFYLIVTKGYTCVQYVTLQNEVDTTQIPKDKYEKLYRSLAYYLEKKGIRGKIKFIGGDLCGTDQNAKIAWFDYMGTEMNDVIDGYSFHQYWHFDDTAFNNFQTRLTNLGIMMRHLTETMPKEQRKPVYVTEYGVKGYIKEQNITHYADHVSAPNDPNATPVIEMLKGAWQVAYYQLAALHDGVAGMARWDAYRAKYDGGFQDFSAIGTPYENFKLRPVYYQHMLISAATVPGSANLKLKSEADDNLYQTVALRSPSGSLTLMMSHICT